jgi:hypothetical protein
MGIGRFLTFPRVFSLGARNQRAGARWTTSPRFPQGPSDVANTHALCRRDHVVKTDGDLQILDHRLDGTTRWRTRDGQIGITPPRPYVPEPAPEPDDHGEEPPPF